MIHIWKNTFSESMGEYFARTLKNNDDIDVFNMLWFSFRLTYITESAFFESIRVGDDKYSLLVQKGNGVITVIFSIL